ncbi:protein of unknown function [Thermococcus camini]|uniref:Uncharacterized protein n=1 Tax=Thermococcus camini TaxID=2016373 RepID=A0A7G2DDZ9_9EURY|nr:protein of unknown function [Thermococcus camini]
MIYIVALAFHITVVDVERGVINLSFARTGIFVILSVVAKTKLLLKTTKKTIPNIMYLTRWPI